MMKASRIFQFLVPKDLRFYPCFIEFAKTINSASDLLFQLINQYPQDSKEIIAEIKNLEHKGDEINHKMLQLLGKTLITPFDREDVQLLAHELDEVLDYIDSAAQKILLYQPIAPLTKYLPFATCIKESALELKSLMEKLPDISHPEAIEAGCIRINEYENRMDALFDETISILFKEEKNAIELLKHKEIVQTLEKVTDSTERVANILKSIIIKLV
jgi:predicted phosphate transport protein (TIGR00153 family)